MHRVAAEVLPTVRLAALDDRHEVQGVRLRFLSFLGDQGLHVGLLGVDPLKTLRVFGLNERQLREFGRSSLDLGEVVRGRLPPRLRDVLGGLPPRHFVELVEDVEKVVEILDVGAVFLDAAADLFPVEAT